jgi:hypothetical protein
MACIFDWQEVTSNQVFRGPQASGLLNHVGDVDGMAASLQFVLARFYQNVGEVVYEGYQTG